MIVLVDSSDPSWKEKYLTESASIRNALGENALAVHHIGSTSIPYIKTKPVVDILVEVSLIHDVDEASSTMRDLGYELMGEYGILGRRYFRKSNENGNRAFHVHVFEQQSEYVRGHLVFRDYLLAHPNRAKVYSDLKVAIANQTGISKSDYQVSKIPFIKATESEALEWHKSKP